MFTVNNYINSSQYSCPQIFIVTCIFKGELLSLFQVQVQHKDTEIEQISTELQRRGEELQQKDIELQQKDEELRQKDA